MVRKLCCQGLSFGLLLIFLRAEAFGKSYFFAFEGFSTIRKMLLISFEDMGLALGLCCFFLVASQLARNRFVLQKGIYYGAIFIFLLFLVWAILNLNALKILNTPVNYQLLYYSNLFESNFVADSLSEIMSASLLMKIMGAGTLLIVFGKIFEIMSLRIVLPQRVGSYAGFIIAGALSLYFYIFNFWIMWSCFWCFL